MLLGHICVVDSDEKQLLLPNAQVLKVEQKDLSLSIYCPVFRLIIIC